MLKSSREIFLDRFCEHAESVESSNAVLCYHGNLLRVVRREIELFLKKINAFSSINRFPFLQEGEKLSNVFLSGVVSFGSNLKLSSRKHFC